MNEKPGDSDGISLLLTESDFVFKEKLKRKVLGAETASRLEQHAFNSLLDTLGFQSRSKNAISSEIAKHSKPNKSEQVSNDPTSQPSQITDIPRETELRVSDLQVSPTKFKFEFEDFESMQVRIRRDD